MGGAGFEPAKAVPPDLQSGPFGRLGIHPSWVPPSHRPSTRRVMFRRLGDRRLPPLDRAGGETRTHNLRFTKPLLCQLSYASNLGRKIPYDIARVNDCKRIPGPTRRPPIGAIRSW